MTIARPFNDDTLFDEVVQAAIARGMFLISDGQRVAVSPVIPAGWNEIVLRGSKQATQERRPCVA